MRNKRSKTIAMIIAIVLIIMMILPLILSAISYQTASAITQNDINALKNKKKEQEKERVKINESLNKLQKDKADALTQKIAVDMLIDITNQEIDNITELTQNLILSIAEEQLALEEAIEKEAEIYEQFRVRVRVMEETGDSTYLGILFKSSSFTELLGRWELINEIVDSDKELMQTLYDQRIAIEENKLKLEADKSELVAVKKELAERQTELAEQSLEASRLISEMVGDIAKFEKAYDEADAAIVNTEKEIIAAQEKFKLEQEAKKKSTKVVGGAYVWPLPSSTRITSKYGWRKHPILGTSKMHTGLDIGAPKGTQIVAANSGTVIIATYNSGYGNYIVIDHGGGYSTLYAHQSKFASGIKVGSEVKAGQLIGYVGSTGLSTGPHLHFEVRKNGAHVSPNSYLGIK